MCNNYSDYSSFCIIHCILIINSLMMGANGCDIFDSALDLEERHVQEGMAEGRA